MVRNRSVYIEDQWKRYGKKGKFRYDVIAVRQDGMEWSVGAVRTLREAKALKKKNLWSKVNPRGLLLHAKTRSKWKRKK